MSLRVGMLIFEENNPSFKCIDFAATARSYLRYCGIFLKIRECIFPHSAERSGEILSRLGLLISWNIRGIYILGFSHGVFQYSLDVTMDIQAKYRKNHWYTSVYPPDFVLDFLSNSPWIFVYIY